MSPTPISGSSSAPNPPQGTQGDPPKDPILEALRGPILKMVQDDIRNAIDPEKIFQYADIRRHELYWRGNQFLDEIYDNAGNLIDYQPIGGTWTQKTADTSADDSYDTVINDFRGYGRKLIAVLAQGPPNVKAVADDKHNPDHQRRAKMAQKVADLLHSIWDVKRQNRKLFLTYYKNGTAHGYTEFVADGEKYGYTSEPVYSPTQTTLRSLNCPQCGSNTPADDPTQASEACPQCGRPYQPEDVQEEQATIQKQTGTKQYANGCVEHRVESGMRVTTPFDIEDLSQSDWLLYEGEVPRGRVFQKFPELRKKFLNDDMAYGIGGTSTTAGQTTRDLASSPTGTFISPRKGRLLLSMCWVRPAMYENARDTVSLPDQTGQASGQRMELRDALRQLYPKGLRITMVNGDTLAELKESRIDRNWTLSPPEPAENAYPDPICKDYVPAQDETNDYANIARQTWERAIPQVFLDTGRIDTTLQARYRQLPASFIPVKMNAGGDINQAIGKVPHATPDPEMNQYGEQRRTRNAEIIGITPAIYGAGGVEQTAYATNLKRNQAMLQLSIYADAGRSYWVGVTMNSVLLMAEFSGGRIPSPYNSDQGVTFIDNIEDLLQGGFHFEAADGMPMSWPEQRQQMNENLKNSAGNPELMSMFGYTVPANIPDFHDLMIGIPNWKMQNQDAYDKVQRCILKLLQGKAIQQPSSQPPPPGQPPQMIDIPSIPVDEWDDHGFFAQALGDWLDSEEAEDIRDKNNDGFKNVVAFWKAHKGLSLPPPMPPGPPPKPGAGAAPPPKANGVGALGPGKLPPPVAQGAPPQQ